MDELSPALAETRELLSARWAERIRFLEPFRGELTGVIAATDLHDALAHLRDELDYRHLSDITAVDWWPRAPRFEVVYHLFSLTRRARLRLKVPVAEGRSVPSATSLWSGANFMEREVFDIFGIPFSGHPNLQRILTPDDFEGHPLRRDFPIGDVPVDFDIPHRKRFADAPD